MLKIGITGQSGFVGSNLFNTLSLFPEKYERVPFEDSFFSNQNTLNSFIKKCDVIIHLAALSRHTNPKVVYETNLRLINQLVLGMEVENVRPYVLFSSSIQEENQSEYGKSKLDGRRIFEEWARRNRTNFTGMIFPNIFGPFGKPNYVSFVATFCYKLTHGEKPVVNIDNVVRLVYIGNLINYILAKIDGLKLSNEPIIESYFVPYDFEKKVTEILSLLERFKSLYFDKGIIPKLNDNNEINLFNTFCSYINHHTHFPIKVNFKNDYQKEVIEPLELELGEQITSTAIVNIINEKTNSLDKNIRFTVIQGKASVLMNRIGSHKALDFYLNGKDQSYLDLLKFYTFKITNIGNDKLIGQFWINEY